ncbi:MAG: hypothetical protein HC822_15875 [Oscillochloris sp.]|nr:hypothetical protein [Oscillochloris sp.]
MKPIPIIFLDANTAFRRLAVRVLERHFQADIRLLANADSWPLRFNGSEQPQAVLFGLGSDGLIDPQLMLAIHAALPGVPVVVLGHLDDPAYRSAAFAAGAAAFVSKDTIGDMLIPLLRQLTTCKPDREESV